MSSTQMHREKTPQIPKAGKAGMVETRLEVVFLPISDVERSKRFYEGLGWRLDADFATGDDWRVLQLTPPGSQCSVIFGKGVTSAAPGSVQGLLLIVDDIDAARAELIGDGVDVSEVFHFGGNLHIDGTEGRVPGRDPQDRSYFSWASFSDPDGNGWLMQEIKTRLPGRLTPSPTDRDDAASLAALMKEAEEHHGAYEATAPKHHWSTWYAGYMIAREHGKTPDEAAKDAALRMKKS